MIIDYIFFIFYKTYGELVWMESMCQPWVAGSWCGFTEGCRNWKRCVLCVELAEPWISNQRMWKGRRALPLTSSSLSHDMGHMFSFFLSFCCYFLSFELCSFEAWTSEKAHTWALHFGRSPADLGRHDFRSQAQPEQRAVDASQCCPKRSRIQGNGICMKIIQPRNAMNRHECYLQDVHAWFRTNSNFQPSLANRQGLSKIDRPWSAHLSQQPRSSSWPQKCSSCRLPSSSKMRSKFSIDGICS